ncbi:MAG TPA: dihydrofolate reductase family protein [Candidatus Angelobacter sp.]|nr:dihydrofolate reductase family protein [Candidatus Angelobacter sp.]
MGRLIYNLNVSLDGYIAASDGSLDWTSVDDEVHAWFNDRMRDVQVSLYGRRLYELMAAYWPTAEEDPAATETMLEFARLWRETSRIVFSTTLDRVEHNSRLVRGDVGEVLAALRTEFDGDLEVGGANLAGQFVRRDLVDDYRLVIHPVALGGGVPFWPTLDGPLELVQTGMHRFASGIVVLSYERRRS